MAHRERDVFFAVSDAGDGGDGAARDNFAEEDDAAANFAGCFAADVEAEIDFVEIRVERDGEEAKELRLQKAKADEAHVGFAGEGIEFGAARDVRAEEGEIGFVVEHQKVAPFGGEEDAVWLVR